MSIAEWVFWGGVTGVVYSYAGYPVLLGAWAGLVRMFGSAHAEERVAKPGGGVAVAVVIAAHNEEKHIGPRLANLLGQSYPSELVRIYVGSDGSIDQTGEIVRQVGSDRVVLLDFKERRGKMSVLNDLIARTHEPIVIFTDANTEFAPDAIEHMVGRFSDPRVGVVCGELQLTPKGPGRNEDHTYWNLERWLKAREGVVGGLVGANGGIYAMRREVYVVQPANTIVDDFVLSMGAYRKGYRVVYEQKAMAYEEAAADLADEWRRRVRIGAGNFQALWRLRDLLWPGAGMIAFTFWSHKVMRWFVPHFLLAVLVSSALLSTQPFYQNVLAIQVVGYLVAMVAYRAAQGYALPRVLLVPTFVVALNAALLVGFARAILGAQGGAWKRTAR